VRVRRSGLVLGSLEGRLDAGLRCCLEEGWKEEKEGEKREARKLRARHVGEKGREGGPSVALLYTRRGQQDTERRCPLFC